MIFLFAQLIISIMMLTSIQFTPAQAGPRGHSEHISFAAHAKRNSSKSPFDNVTLFQVPPQIAAATTEPGTKGVS